jgi:hypothetical protein
MVQRSPTGKATPKIPSHSPPTGEAHQLAITIAHQLAITIA